MLQGTLDVALVAGSGCLLLLAALMWRHRERVAAAAARLSPSGAPADGFEGGVGLVCGGLVIISCLWLGYALLAP